MGNVVTYYVLKAIQISLKLNVLPGSGPLQAVEGFCENGQQVILSRVVKFVFE